MDHCPEFPDHHLSISAFECGVSPEDYQLSEYVAAHPLLRIRWVLPSTTPHLPIGAGGAFVSLPCPRLARPLRSATSCLGPCTMNRPEWRPADAMLSVSRIGFTDERDAAPGKLANTSLPHAVESEKVGECHHEKCRY